MTRSHLHIIIIILALLAAPAAMANDFLRALPAMSTVLTGYECADSVKARMAAQPLGAVEGLWQMLDGGALVALERHIDPSLPAMAQPGTYRLVMVKAPTRLVRPGTLLGHVCATAKPGVFEARIYTDFARESGLGVARTFYLHLAADGSVLTFKPQKSRLKVNPFALLPYMYRRVFRLQDNRPDDLNGACRVFPPSSSPMFGPRYL